MTLAISVQILNHDSDRICHQYELQNAYLRSKIQKARLFNIIKLDPNNLEAVLGQMLTKMVEKLLCRDIFLTLRRRAEVK